MALLLAGVFPDPKGPLSAAIPAKALISSAEENSKHGWRYVSMVFANTGLLFQSTWCSSSSTAFFKKEAGRAR